MVLAATCWAVNATVAKHIFASGLSPMVLTQLRTVLGASTLAIVLALGARAKLRIRRGDLFRFALLGGVFALNQFAYFESIRLLKVGPAILLEFTGPAFVALYCWLVLGAPPRAVTVAALVGTFFGCALLLGVHHPMDLDSPVGVFAGLVAALTFAAYSLQVESLSTRYGAVTVLQYALAFAGVASVLSSPSTMGTVSQLDVSTWAAALYVSVAGTLLPFGLFLYGISQIAATRATATATLQPVIAAGLAYAFLRETLEPVQWLGGAVVVFSIVALKLVPTGKSYPASTRALSLSNPRSNMGPTIESINNPK